MAQSFTRTARQFFSPEAIFPFLFGSIALGVLSNAVFTLCTIEIGTDRPSVMMIAGGSLLLLVIAVCIVARLVRRLPVSASLPGKRSPAQHRGLIFLVSKKEPCRKAIAFHSPKLERVWLICSNATLPVCKELREDYQNLILDDPHVINDVYDPLEYYSAVQRIHRTLPDGWANAEVIADYAGMTVQASVGMVMACLNGSHPLQYTPAEFDEQSKPIRSLDPIEVTFEGLR